MDGIMKFTKDEIHNAILVHHKKVFGNSFKKRETRYEIAGFVRDALDYFDKEKEENKQIKELETLLTDWMEYRERVGKGYSEATEWEVDFYDRVEEVLNKNKTEQK